MQVITNRLHSTWETFTVLNKLDMVCNGTTMDLRDMLWCAVDFVFAIWECRPPITTHILPHGYDFTKNSKNLKQTFLRSISEVDFIQ